MSARRRFARDLAPSRVQATPSLATKSMRSIAGSCRSEAYSRSSSASVSDLNEMARVKSRPSSSGSTTFMARSLGASPRDDVDHASWLPPASATCSTGQSAASRTVVSSSRRAENAVALMMTEGRRRATSALIASAADGSLRLVMASAIGSSPSAANLCMRARMGAVSAASRLER